MNTLQCDGNFLMREALYPGPWPFLGWSPAWSSPVFLPGPEQQPSVGSTSRVWPRPGAPSTCLNTPPLLGSRLRGTCNLCSPLGLGIPCKLSLQADPFCQDFVPAQNCCWSPAPPLPQLPILGSSKPPPHPASLSGYLSD